MLIKIIHTLELDALSDMDENELSYLDDIKAQPDFLDEAPHVPSNEVSFHYTSLQFSCMTISWFILGHSCPHMLKRQEPPYEDKGQWQLFAPYFVLWEDIYVLSWLLSSPVANVSHLVTFARCTSPGCGVIPSYLSKFSHCSP